MNDRKDPADRAKKFKKLAKNTFNFAINRIIQIIGMVVKVLV